MPALNHIPPASNAPGRAWQLELPVSGASPEAAPSLGADSLALGGGTRTAIAPLWSSQAASAFPNLFRSLKSWSLRLLTWLAQPAQPAQPAPRTPPVTQPGAPQPNGSLAQAIAASPAGQPLALGAATYAFNGFGSAIGNLKRSEHNGLDLPAKIPGLAGAGIDRTIIRMAPRTSTNAKDVPTTPMTTNQYTLMRVTGDGLNLRDFTLQATDQGHLYNGLRVHRSANPRITNVKVTGVPGNYHAPPGETFGINDYRTSGAIYKNIEVNGQGVGASGFGANNSTNVKIERGVFYGNPYGIGATFWQTKDATLIDCTSKDNRTGFNFERVSGTVNLIRPVMSNITRNHISIGTDQANAVYNIIDPVLPPGQKLRIYVAKNYLGKPSPQQRSNVRVIVNGVDRTQELVQWA